SMFPVLPNEAATVLRDWCFFWDWNSVTSQHRWMTSWDTTQPDVDRFLEGVQLVMSSVEHHN
ncbi:MAG: threonine aldolase, partial [Ilumatobacteraceae bacterium]